MSTRHLDLRRRIARERIRGSGVYGGGGIPGCSQITWRHLGQPTRSGLFWSTYEAIVFGGHGNLIRVSLDLNHKNQGRKLTSHNTKKTVHDRRGKEDVCLSVCLFVFPLDRFPLLLGLALLSCGVVPYLSKIQAPSDLTN